MKWIIHLLNSSNSSKNFEKNWEFERSERLINFSFCKLYMYTVYRNLQCSSRVRGSITLLCSPQDFITLRKTCPMSFSPDVPGSVNSLLKQFLSCISVVHGDISLRDDRVIVLLIQQHNYTPAFAPAFDHASQHVAIVFWVNLLQHTRAKLTRDKGCHRKNSKNKMLALSLFKF